MNLRFFKGYTPEEETDVPYHPRGIKRASLERPCTARFLSVMGLLTATVTTTLALSRSSKSIKEILMRTELGESPVAFKIDQIGTRAQITFFENAVQLP